MVPCQLDSAFTTFLVWFLHQVIWSLHLKEGHALGCSVCPLNLWINTKYSLISDLERGQVSVHQTSCAWISIILLYSMSFIRMYPSSSVFAVTMWLFWSDCVTNRYSSDWVHNWVQNWVHNWVHFPETITIASLATSFCEMTLLAMWPFIWGLKRWDLRTVASLIESTEFKTWRMKCHSSSCDRLIGG